MASNTIELSRIHNTVELIKQIDCSKSALVTDVAKEMGVKKTLLMEFINQNPWLFKVDEMWTYKKCKEVSYYFKGKPQYTTMMKKDKCKGLAIVKTYPSPEDNPASPWWLQRQKEQNVKTLFVKYWDNYGVKEGLYVEADPQDGGLRTGQWRNTPEKIEALKSRGILFTTTFYIGGFGDCTQHKVETATNEEKLSILKEEGWKIEYQK